MRGCSGRWWLGMLRRIPCLHRGSDYLRCGRQNDVIGAFFAPVTSPHSRSGDIMTSPDCVCAGNWLTIRILRQARRLYHLRERATDRGFCHQAGSRGSPAGAFDVVPLRLHHAVCVLEIHTSGQICAIDKYVSLGFIPWTDTIGPTHRHDDGSHQRHHGQGRSSRGRER